MRISIELGRFIEIMREGDQYVAIFENASWEIPDELIEFGLHRG
jgi:hypothetical protein